MFRLQVNYVLGVTGKWSNVWHVSATDIPAVETAVNDALVPDLLPALDNQATLKSVLISSESDDTFTTVNVNSAGTNSGSGDLLPLFNSAKVLFDDGSLGRPDYKFVKGFVTEGEQTNGQLTTGASGALKTIFDALIADMDAAGAPLVSEDNDAYVSSSVQTAVQMRQMHRKRRKAVAP